MADNELIRKQISALFDKASDAIQTNNTAALKSIADAKQAALALLPDPVVVAPPVVDPPVVVKPGMKTVVIGQAELSNLGNVSDTIFQLKPGTYTQTNNLSNLKNCIIDGMNAVVFNGVKGNIFVLSGLMQGLTFQNFSTKDCSNAYQIWTTGFRGIYNSNDPKSYFSDVKLINIKSDNGSILFHMDGDVLADGSNRGVIKGFGMSGCSFINAPAAGMVVYLGNGLAYDVHDNIVDNMNTKQNDHNGLFFLKGNGKFYNNKVSNHQGNALRSWGFSQNGGETIEVYNNLIVNSRKYSAFEFQAQKENIGTTSFKPADVNVYNNTAGNLNLSHDWNGELFDMYNLSGGKVTSKNNLGFNMFNGEGKAIDNNMVNGQFNTPITNSGNQYFPKQSDAVDANFKSLIVGIGAQ